MAYKNIPVDEETAQIILALCVFYEMGKRAQGALVKKLAKAEYQKLRDVKLAAAIPAPVLEDGLCPASNDAV